MIYIENENTDPAFNLALEEYALRNLDIDYDYLLIYRNRPSIIIGKHQNVVEEVNLRFAHENALPVLRRISGGGAVYHDLGNINFSFITRHTGTNINQYRIFLQPIIKTIEGFGLSVQLNERNNLLIDGKKISGNAQFSSRDRLLSHGTLLFDTDLRAMSASLSRSNGLMINSKSTKSVRSEVTNLKEHFGQEVSVDHFIKRMVRDIAGSAPDLFKFSPAQLLEIESLAEQKYGTWDWNYGRSPACTIQIEKVVNEKRIRCSAKIGQGCLNQVRIDSDDWFGDEIKFIVDRLESVKFDFISIGLLNRQIAGRSEILKTFDLLELFF